MRSPLLLMQLERKGEKIWRTARSERSVRGWDATAIVFVREPTEEEEATVQPYRDAGIPILYLEDLVEGELDG